MATDTHALEEGYVELGVDATVVVAASWRNATLSFKRPQMFGTHAELATSFAYVPKCCCSPRSVHAVNVSMCRMNLEHYDTHQLRHLAAKRLGLNDVPDAFWAKRVTRQYVLLWEEASSRPAHRSEIQERLVDLVREDITAYKNMGFDITAWTTPQQRGRSSVERDISADDPLALRAEALCVYWAKLAEADRAVRSFRTKVLGGTAISADEAGQLITSPAAALMRAEYFSRENVPIVGHTAELDVSERSNPFARPYRIRGSLRIQWPTGQAALPVHNMGPAPPEPMEVWNGIELTLIAPWPLSVLGELRKVASKLTEHFPWQIRDAAWFVLTNEPPWVPPLTATGSGPNSVTNHGTITIKAAHWVPEEAVSELYLWLKAKMKPAPTTSPRRLALFRFVVERSSGVDRWESSKPGEAKDVHVRGLDTPTWRSLQTQWNEQYPLGHKWHYRDHRNLRRDFAEASAGLIGY